MASSAAMMLVSCSSIWSQKKDSELTSQIQTLLRVKFTPEDLNLLAATNAVINSYQNFALSRYHDSMNLSKQILYTPHLTPEIYKFALSFYTLSLIFSVDDKSMFEKKAWISKMNFDSFQYEECTALCDSIGWKALAQKNTALFTPEGYDRFLIRQDILELAQKKMPNWFFHNVLSEKKNKPFEDTQTPAEAISLASPFLENSDSPLIKPLQLFANGDFHSSLKNLQEISKNLDDKDTLSGVFYWIGRNYYALHDMDKANQYFLLSGNTSPLGLYDSLSGQMLKTTSGKASTSLVSPFDRPWQEEMDRWVSYPKLSLPMESKGNKVFSDFNFIQSSLKSAVLLSSKIRIEKHLDHVQEYQNELRIGSNSVEKIVLRDELKWLQDHWIPLSESWEAPFQKNDISESIAWLLYSNGDFLNSALFVSQAKDTFNLSSDKNRFLYFIFYPRPDLNLITPASAKCVVDPDLIYAILRQENFFATKQTEESLAETVCLLHSLLEKYNNNLVSTLTSYKTGTHFVDILRKHLSQTQDDVIFIEMIPDEKTRVFVQNALRNYYNIKWIYFQKKQNKNLYTPALTLM